MKYIVIGAAKNEVDTIQCISSCLTKYLNTCPTFFAGSLEDACRKAYRPQVREQVRLQIFLLLNIKH